MNRPRVIALIAVLGTCGILLIGQVRQDFAERCTESWDSATSVDVSRLTLSPEEVGRVSPVRKVDIGGRPFEVQALIYKSMGYASAPVNPFHRQGISVIFEAVAEDATTLKALAPLCIRATLDNNTWERRSRQRDTYVRGFDGHVVGGAGVTGGPEWSADAIVQVQLLATFEGRRYVLDDSAAPVRRTD